MFGLLLQVLEGREDVPERDLGGAFQAKAMRLEDQRPYNNRT